MANVDEQLQEQIRKGNIFEGQKLSVWGARLSGGSEGASPLENHNQRLEL